MTSLVEAAEAFAVQAHEGQYRKGAGRVPYVTHPGEVVASLRGAGVSDEVTLAAAWLHDTMEDAGVEHEVLRDLFGPEVADVVRELTDDASLPKADRKRLQAERAPRMSPRAKLVKLADKLANVRSLVANPPGWKPESVRGYVRSARAVVDALGEVNPKLETEFRAAEQSALNTLSE